MAVAVAKQGGDVSGNAQAAAQMANLHGLQKAHDTVAKQVGGESILHRALGWLDKGFHTAVQAVEANPLNPLAGVAQSQLEQAAESKGPQQGALGVLQKGLSGASSLAQQGPAGQAAQFVGRTIQQTTDAFTNPGTVQAAAGTPPPMGPSIGDRFVAAGRALEQAPGNLAKAANLPLNEVQHQYRYLRDVAATHGPLDAALQGLLIGAGGVAGGKIAGSRGVVLGAEAAAESGRILDPQAWQRTQNGATYRDPHTGQPVSIGRDAASVLGLSPGTLAFKTVSGIGDAVSDMALDPVGQAGGLIGQARSPEGLGGLMGNVLGGTAAKGATAVQAAEDVGRVVRQYPSVARAFDYIANHDSGSILARFPQLATGPNGEADRLLLSRLGQAATRAEVQSVFEDAVRTNELTQADRLPTLTTTRDLALRAADRASNYQGPGAQLPLVGPARMARAFRQVPRVFDPDTGHFTRAEFTLGDDYGANAIYHMLLMGERPDVARGVVNAYLNEPTAAGRLAIYRNAVTDTLIAMARNNNGDLALNDEDVRQLGANVDELLKASSPGVGGVYGMDDAGRNISTVATDTGKRISAAITPNQVGKVALPDFVAMKRAANELAGGRQALGKLDDFFYHHVTQAWFKRWILQSGSFALHVAIGEGIPNALRLGATNLVKSRIEATIGKLGYRVGNDEASRLSHFVWSALGGKLSNLDDVDFALRFAHATGGHNVAPGLTAAHNFEDEVAGPVEASTRSLRAGYYSAPDKFRSTDEFTTYRSQGSEGGAAAKQADFARAWQQELAENAGQEPTRIAAQTILDGARQGVTRDQAITSAEQAVKAWLDAQPEQWLQQFERHYYKSPLADPGASPHEDWAAVITRKVLGSVTGDDGTLHADLLGKVASGGSFDEAALRRIPVEQQPLNVKGRIFEKMGAGNLERLAAVGFRKVLSPFINYWSREPLSFAETKAQWNLLKPRVDSGELDPETAMGIAVSRASTKAIRFVHNINERTQMAETLRNWSPFFFAQEQAYKRVGRLLAEDPGALRRYQMILSAVHTMGQQTKDENGQNYFVYPGSGWLLPGTTRALGALGLPVIGSNPIVATGNLGASSVIFPFAEGVQPGLGPVVAVPLKGIANLFPDVARHWKLPGAVTNAVESTAQGALGPIASSEPMWKQLVPNVAVQRVLEAAIGDSTAFNSSFMHTMQALAYQQNLAVDQWRANPKVAAYLTANPQKSLDLQGVADAVGIPLPQIIPAENAPDTDKQTFLNRVRNQTKVNFFMKALLGLVAPVSPSLKVDDWGLPAELNNEIKAANNNVAVGMQNFLSKHPDATPFTVFQSTSKTGSSIPYTRQAEDWVTHNLDFIDRYPLAATWFLPPVDATQYDPAVYNEQVAQGLRERRLPADFLNQLYIAAGNHQYYDVDRPAYYSALLQATTGISAQAAAAAVKNGLTGQQLATVERSARGKAIRNAWTTYQQQVQALHPVWATDFTSGQGAQRRTQVISQLQAAVKVGAAPKGPQGDAIRSLLADYNTYHSMYLAGRADSWAALSAATLKDAWQAYLTRVAAAKPQLAGIIHSVFLEAT